MPAQSRQIDNGTMTDEELNTAIAEAQRRRYAAIKAPFEVYSRGDMIRFVYDKGTISGQPRVARFNKFVDLKNGPGMQAIHANKPKKYYLRDISAHELADADEPASDVEDNSPEPSEASDDEDIETIQEASDEESTESESESEDLDLDGQLGSANLVYDEIVALPARV
eukprot:COSAG01_NODE_15844_length_1293_cov_1.793970_1_plen_168_part_00